MRDASIEAGQDIAALRAALKPLSESLIAEVKQGGLDQVGSAYVAHCPMAFDNAGANWLTPANDIANPYFGAEMLNCGSLTERLSAGNESEGDTTKQP